jgi:hypothetical protein
MFILYTIVDNCNHCSPVNTSSIADGIFNSLNKVFIYLFNFHLNTAYLTYRLTNQSLAQCAKPDRRLDAGV